MKKENHTKQLLLVKTLYEHAKMHAYNNTGIDRIITIHNLDNSIEWLLKSVALKFEIKLQKNNRYKSLYDLWDEINEKLPLHDEIFGLHDLRNKVQHHANIPSSEDVQRYLSSSEEFILKILKSVFDIDYDALCLSSLIENTTLRAVISKAEKAFENGEYEESICACMNAFTDATWGTESIEGIAFPAGRLTGHFGASDELNNMTDTEYVKKNYLNNKLAEEVGKALLQLAQSSTCMQFLTLPQKVQFLKFFVNEKKTSALSKNQVIYHRGERIVRR
ncbi:MAG: hypothetical protein KAT65_21900, partial [Methanophagales archaeon]|nr:hypothetical protein [Methanophagales archaeon]